MLKSFALLSFRNLVKNRLFSLVNILGLSVGLACVTLIALFVSHELSYDKHWEKADRTYKVMRTFMPSNGSADLELATNAPQTGPLLKLDFPELEHVVRLLNGGDLVVNHPETNETQYENGIYFADSDIYKAFDIPLLQGDWDTALLAPFQMVISETLANRYFENGDALGKTLLVAGRAPVNITGVMKDMENNSHLAMQGLASIETTQIMFGDSFLENWGSNSFHTYIVTPENYDISNFEREIPGFLTRHIADNATDFTDFVVMPLTDIHLHSNRENELRVNGSITTVYTFTAIATFILLIACFNFMNLSTARSASRAREVGLRKTLGADRLQIMIQFLGESVLLTMIATALAVGVAELLLPWFNTLLDMELSISYLENPGIMISLIALSMTVGLIAGSYPAFYLSSFSSAEILKGELTRGSAAVAMRKALVVVQFSISIALVIASGIALSQLNFAMTMDPGYTKEQVVEFSGDAIAGLGPSYNTFKQELLRNPEIQFVTAANLMPGDQNTNSDGVRYEGKDEGYMGMSYLNVDYNFFETFGIQLLAGRDFSEQRGTDIFVEPSEENPLSTGSFILNEIAVGVLGFEVEEAIGKWFEVSRRGADGESYAVRGEIIGVADNIYFSSIHEAVKPVYYRITEHDNPNAQFPNFGTMAVKMSGRNISDTLDFIEQAWQRFVPGTPYQQEFMDQKITALYDSERRQGQIFTVFSMIAIFVAALGLFGLASYLTEQRTKEIGVRKVLGSSVREIVTLLTRDFSKLVLIANLIAWPVAWYFMDQWLEGFAYRTSITIWTFLFAGFLAWIVASATVGALAAITANVNPTLSLRHE